MADLARAELIERLEGLSGPDREVDEALALTYDGFKAVYEVGMAGNWWHRFTQGGLTAAVPAYTASIDAAVALVEKALPGGDWSVSRTGKAHGGFIYLEQQYDGISRASASVALCIALLRALEKEGAEE
jgi:hypothetical protein